MKPFAAAWMLLLVLPTSAIAQQPSSPGDAGETQARSEDRPLAPPSTGARAIALDPWLPSLVRSNVSAQEQAGKSGFDHGFYIQSADGAFVFRPFGLIHTDLRLAESGRQINTDATQASTFVVRRLRIGFEGQLYRSIAYDLEANVGAGGAELIYAWMNFGHMPRAQVRVGQFKEPFSYEVLLPETSLDFVERSVVATVVAPAEDIGAMLHNFGAPLGGLVEYGIGMFNGLGATLEKTDPNKTFEYVGRLAIYPFAASSNRFFKSTRIAGYALVEGNRPQGVDIKPRTPLGFEFMPRIPTNGRRLATGGDVQFILGPFSTKAEYIRNIEDTPSGRDAVMNGWHVDVTHVVTGQAKVLTLKEATVIADARAWAEKVRAAVRLERK